MITGHTGFKGSWLTFWLHEMGAEVCGYALEAPKDSLYDLIDGDGLCVSRIGDIADFEHLKEVFDAFSPEIVFHLAAQPIVREGYRAPRTTYLTNVMGTVNLLECIRLNGKVRSFLNVTTDKVYKNEEWEWGYRESEPLDGYDPYSNSKSCSELVTYSYRNSFFSDGRVAISTARAGNVIGGGDFAADRIIPDCMRAVMRGKEIILRNPASTRPYQHVLEPVLAYLLIAEKQYRDGKYAGCYNVGPEETSCLTTGELVAMFCGQWKERTGIEPVCMIAAQGGPHEANFLKLDCSKIKSRLGWRPVWNAEKMMEATVEWIVAYSRRENVHEVMKKQIHEYLSCIQAETEKGKTEL